MMNQPLDSADSQVQAAIRRELERERADVELIASENYVSRAVMEAMGSCLTNKYAEGLPGKRYYGGCEAVDEAEDLARDRAKELFHCEWVNVQPHSGASANAAVYLTLLEPGDTFLGLDLSHGGHLTHGSPVNFSGITYHAIHYRVRKNGPDAGYIDMDEVRTKALEHRPKMISIGASAYPRDFDYEAFRSIADEIGAFLWMDMAHTAGLIAKGLLKDPLPVCDVVSTTTHKTLRGPRGGMLLLGRDTENRLGKVAAKSGRTKMMSELLDAAVFPGCQGGPLMHVIAAKAVAFGEALRPEFETYGRQVIANAKAMAEAFCEKGYDLVSGGTDNHLVLVDLRNKGVSGKKAERLLGAAGITVNKNMVPYDDRSPMVTSGIRLGTAAMTTRGFTEEDFRTVVGLIDRLIAKPDDAATTEQVKGAVEEILRAHPLYTF